jgi:SAM-dependent methyltransferase
MKRKTYAEASKNFPPNKLVRQAITFLKSKDSALDIGAGSLRDSSFLQSEGFKKVTAIDKNVQDVDEEKIEFIHGNIEDFNFFRQKYDLVVAINILPFLENDDFKKIFPEILDSIKKEGVFCFTLFGLNDDWNLGEKKMNFHSKSEVLDMLKDFSDIKIFIEEERDGGTVNGDEKHWHIFRVVAVK